MHVTARAVSRSQCSVYGVSQKTGCTWTGLTVSKQQLEEAVARVKAAGLSDRIQLLFCDYREGHGLGLFDKVCAKPPASLAMSTLGAQPLLDQRFAVGLACSS